MSRWQIKGIRSYIIQTLGVGANYAWRGPGHWIVDDLRGGIASVDAGTFVEIETNDGKISLSGAPGWALRLNRDAVELKRYTV